MAKPRKKKSSKRVTALTVPGPTMVYARPRAEPRASSWGGGGGRIMVMTGAPTKARRGGGGGRKKGAGAGAGEKVRKGAAIGGAILGYVSKNHMAQVNKLPALFGSRLLVIAIGAHYLAKKRPGGIIDHVATAATAIAAFNFGQAGFSMDELKARASDTSLQGTNTADGTNW